MFASKISEHFIYYPSTNINLVLSPKLPFTFLYAKFVIKISKTKCLLEIIYESLRMNKWMQAEV